MPLRFASMCFYLILCLLFPSLLILWPKAAAAEGASPSPIRQRLQGYLVGAHRGGMASFGLLENSLTQFEKARRAGVDIIEMDLRLTKDGFVLVSHDHELYTKTDCDKDIRDKMLQEIKKCKLTISGEFLSTFEEVLRWSKGRVVINAEFKIDEVVRPAIKLIQDHNAYDWVYFSTSGFRHRYQIARGVDPNVALSFAPIDEESLHWALNLDDPNLMVIEIHKNIRKPHLIKLIKEAGKLTSENAWHFTKYLNRYENLWAGCAGVFQHQIDIAITNRPKSCLLQRNQFREDAARE